MPAGVHNGNRIQGAKRSRIIEAIAQGECVASICRRFRMSPRSVIAVREAEWQTVANRKEVLASQFEQIATAAADRMLQELKSPRKIPLAVLNPVAGVAIDKVAILRGDSISTIRHIHSIDIQDEDIVAFCVSRSEKRAKAAVVEVQALPDAEQAPSANTRNRNPRKH